MAQCGYWPTPDLQRLRREEEEVRDSIAGLALLGCAALAWVMSLLAGRDPGALGPEIDSPFYDANVASLDTHLWEEI